MEEFFSLFVLSQCSNLLIYLVKKTLKATSYLLLRDGSFSKILAIIIANLALANATNNSPFLLMKFDCKALVCCSIWRVWFYAGVKCTLVGSTAGGWKSMKGTVFALFGDGWLCLMKDTGLSRVGRGKLHWKTCAYTKVFYLSTVNLTLKFLIALTVKYNIFIPRNIPQKRKKISRDLFNVSAISLTQQ